MFPFDLSLFDTGLLITVVVFMLLYLVVLVRLKPSTVGEKTVKAKAVKQEIQQPISIERIDNPVVDNENHEEPEERITAIESPNSVPTMPTEMRARMENEKNDFSGGAKPSGCPHYFGYLKEHPKNTPIPNECLTCTKIMECLVGIE